MMGDCSSLVDYIGKFKNLSRSDSTDFTSIQVDHSFKLFESNLHYYADQASAIG